MKKIWIIFSMLALFGLSSFSQLSVANKFGKDLYVGINGKEELIPNTGVKIFASIRTRNVLLDCRSVDGTVKFTVSKDVSRSGLVVVLSSDASTTVVAVNPTSVSYSVPVPVVASNDDSGSSLSSLLNGTSNSEVSYTQSTTLVTTQVANTPVSQPVITGEPVTIEYSGMRTLKIISREGQGLELIGSADSASNQSGAKNKYTIYVRKNTDLVIGVGQKKQANQAVWPYGEIRKRINAGDVVCKITDADVKMMATNENTKLKFKVDAKGYKILIETDAGDIISLGDKGTSKEVTLPIGQSYIRIAYTDASGEFHPTAFMPIHTTFEDHFIVIDQNALKKTLAISNF